MTNDPKRLNANEQGDEHAGRASIKTFLRKRWLTMSIMGS
jgi:hypothetical protein